jgi:RNA polymerase sigma factor (TIGR02999 family)
LKPFSSIFSSPAAAESFLPLTQTARSRGKAIQIASAKPQLRRKTLNLEMKQEFESDSMEVIDHCQPTHGGGFLQPARGEITVLLAKWKNGEPSAFEDLMPLVYPHLREVAAAYVRRERNPDLLQGTALVHELYLRLLNQKKAVGEDRRHFYAFAAKVMRMILIDHAREMQTQMRGGDRERIPLSDDLAWIDIDSPELLDLNRALDELAALDANKVQLVELRYFLGCTTEETPRRPSQAAGAGKRLDADLEAILLKALRKEPRDRYLTAEQLASDIRAWLQGLPVAARHGTVRYRACKFIRRNRISVASTALLAASLIAGVIGVAWQARVANQERRRAQESAADLRQLSNSLLSELDEAIKELPGSTGAQKLLVTRVLEHLDRTARNAHGDRQTQLDLINAYSQLGEIQGDPYVQNLGDPHAALISIGKAIDMATPLVASRPGDRDALRLLALAQQYKSDVLFGMAETEEAVRSMRASSDVWDKLTAAGDLTPGLLCDAGSAYGTLGDELGQSGVASLEDSAGATTAYLKALAADNRALSIDPHFPRAMRGISIYEMKIGSVMMETDPASAVKEFEAALQNANTLPDSEKSRLSTQRMRAMLMRKQAIALEQLGEYERSVPLFQQAIETERRIAALDSKDSRAQFDLVVVLDDTAQGYEDAADPALAAQPGEGRKNLMLARNYLAQARMDLSVC